MVGEPQDRFVRAADDHVQPLAAPSARSASPQTQPSARRASTLKEISFYRDLIPVPFAYNDSLPNTREEDRPQHRYSPRDRPDVNMDEPITYYPQQRICSICDRARAEPDMRPSPAPTAARDVVPRPTGFVALVTEMETLTCTSGPRLAVGAGLDHRLRGTRSMTLPLPDIEGSVRRLGALHRLPDVDGSVRRLEVRRHLPGGARSSTIRLPDVEARRRLGGRRHLGARSLSLGVRCVGAASTRSACWDVVCVGIATMLSFAWERVTGTKRR
ncbi:hypothetical protein CcaCcLH18_10534 [Colletotrichum camelliae]|nr:hypothetical protein CcaCcLH18_10534 [Colletotrichum camelliae]